MKHFKKGEVYMSYLIFLGGVFVGSLISSFMWWRRTSLGTLRIDHSNPEKDIYRFEVDNLDKVSKNKRIMMKIDNNADLPA